MNENCSQIYDEVEIDIKDLFFYLLRHWRSLLVVIILGALLGSGIYVAKKASFEKNMAASTEQDNWVDTYQVAPEIKAKMDLAWENRKAFEKQLSYNQNSLIMKMDAEHVYNGKLKYYIAAGSSTRLIAEQFNSVLNDGDLAKELKDVAGLECDAQYIRELLGCDVNTDTDSSVNISSTEDGATPSTKNVVVTYTVNYMDEDACRKMLNLIQKQADSLNDTLQKEYGAFTCNQLGSSVVLTVSSSYLSQQKTNVDYLQTYANNFNTIESALEDKDLEYYLITYLNKEATVDQPAAFSGSKLKWLIVSIFGLVCCWGIVLVLRYVFNENIKTADEVKMRYQLPILGILRAGETKKGIDGFIEKADQSGRFQVDTVDYVAHTISLLDGKQIMFCCETLNAHVETTIAELKNVCSSLISARYVGKDADALETAKKMDGIILAVEKGMTPYADIERCLEGCSLQKIKILGVVFLV